MNIPIMTTPVLADFAPDEFEAWCVSDFAPDIRNQFDSRTSNDLARWAVPNILDIDGIHLRLRCVRTGSLYIVRRKRAAKT